MVEFRVTGLGWGLGIGEPLCRVYSVLLRGSKNYQNKTFRNIAKLLHRGKDTVTDFYLFDCLFLLEYTSKATPLKATKSLQLCDSFSNIETNKTSSLSQPSREIKMSGYNSGSIRRVMYLLNLNLISICPIC